MMSDGKIISAATAKQWLQYNRLILDTETTGLDSTAEIVEVAIINCQGEVLLNTLVRPVHSIPAEATAIHSITNEMVANAPGWKDIHNKVISLLRPTGFIAYNSDFDARLMVQTADISHALHEDPVAEVLEINAMHDCAMLLYAEFYGQWNEQRGSYRWQRLTAAAEQQGVKAEGQPHRALSDCLLTLGIIKAIAAGGAK